MKIWFLRFLPNSLKRPKLAEKLPDTWFHRNRANPFGAIPLASPEGPRISYAEMLYQFLGFGWSETHRIEKGQIFEYGFLRRGGKGNKERFRPIEKDAWNIWNIYREEVRMHFRPFKGTWGICLPQPERQETYSRNDRSWSSKKLQNKAGIEINEKSPLFRHSFATHLVVAWEADLEPFRKALAMKALRQRRFTAHLGQRLR